MAAPPAADSRLPVFVFPSTINFFSDDQTTYKQIVTLYNPYDFNLRFKVLSTAPHKYMVVDSEGVVKARCCVDIVIRHTEVGGFNERVRDKFRIQLSDYHSKKLMGWKDVVATLLPSKSDMAQQDDKFESLPQRIGTSTKPVQQTITPPSTAAAPGGTGPNFIVIFAAVSCIVALMLPNQNENGETSESRLPSYLHTSLNQKLIAAYVLGLVTMVLLRT